VDYNQEFQINIINKDGLSDTWRLEDTPSTKKELPYKTYTDLTLE
jgi:hypothetical protein